MLHRAIVIVGGGPVGLALALSLARHGKSILLIDHGIKHHQDVRILALSHASHAILAQLNAWPSAAASAIDSVQISHPGLGISTITAAALGLEHLGYTLSYATLCAELLAQVVLQPLITLVDAQVTAVSDGASFSTVSYQSSLIPATYLTADLVIMAEGGKLIEQQFKKINHNYQQQALVAQIETPLKAGTTAYERFGGAGPLVLLPRAKNFVMVWSLNNQLAQELKNNPQQLILNLNKEFTQRLGGARLVGEISSFPLQLSQVKKRLLQRIILVGNSAQTVHPISAQGLNLGLRDVVVLSELLAATPQLDLTRLSAFDKLRNKDATAVIGFTHFLATFLERQNKFTRHLRGAGIVALSNLPFAQNFIARSLIFGI